MQLALLGLYMLHVLFRMTGDFCFISKLSSCGRVPWVPVCWPVVFVLWQVGCVVLRYLWQQPSFCHHLRFCG